jgi:hypothetical protein
MEVVTVFPPRHYRDGVANRPADDSALLASAFNLPASPFSSSLIQLARRPAEAEAFTVRMLYRSVYFQGNEEVSGPKRT